jgi:ABC-type microcin C transport system duplicated ATPase subunit YejF
MRAVRGGRMGMIFQEPQTSLNPVLTVGAQIAEAVRVHEGRRAAASARASSSCCARWASRTRSGAPMSIRTSSPAA